MTVHRALVGMGAIVLDGVEVGAGALLTPSMRVASGQLVVGNPARAVRALTDEERTSLLASAVNYARVAAEYRTASLR